MQCASLVQAQGIEHDSCMHASQLHGVLSRSIMQVAVSSTSGPISPPSLVSLRTDWCAGLLW